MSSARSTRAKPPPVSGHSHGKPRSICPIARSPPKSPPTPSDLTHVSAIIHVERAVYTRQAATGLWTFSRETSFYLSNRPLAAEIAADAIRSDARERHHPCRARGLHAPSRHRSLEILTGNLVLFVQSPARRRNRRRRHQI